MTRITLAGAMLLTSMFMANAMAQDSFDAMVTNIGKTIAVIGDGRNPSSRCVNNEAPECVHLQLFIPYKEWVKLGFEKPFKGQLWIARWVDGKLKLVEGCEIRYKPRVRLPEEQGMYQRLPVNRALNACPEPSPYIANLLKELKP